MLEHICSNFFSLFLSYVKEKSKTFKHRLGGVRVNVVPWF
jgi:hypothetical protein